MRTFKEIKWDIKKGAGIYRTIYTSRLCNWIINGIIKEGDVFVWRSGFSGWRKPDELEELIPFFEEYKKKQLRELKKERKVLIPRKKIKKILIVDDEKDMCWLLSEALCKRRYKVTTASTGKEGIAQVKKEIPDLVFLDLKLPDTDGTKVLHRIKKINPKIAVCIITAYGTPDLRKEARNKGAFYFLDKPFTIKEILRAIRESSKRF